MEIQWKSMKINENPWNPWTCMGYICFDKKEMDYIFYSKKIDASHICPPKRNKLFKQREWKSSFSAKRGLGPAKHGSKSLFWWRHEIIPRPFWFSNKNVHTFEKWKKTNLAKGSRPPDCGITSVSSHEYVCFHFQPIKWQDCIEIDEQSLTNIENP